MTEIENADITVYNRVSLEASSFASAVSYVALCNVDGRLTEDKWVARYKNETNSTFLLKSTDNNAYWVRQFDKIEKRAIFDEGTNDYEFNNIALLNADMNILAVRYIHVMYVAKKVTVLVDIKTEYKETFDYNISFVLDYSQHIEDAVENLVNEHPNLNSETGHIADKSYIEAKINQFFAKNSNIIEINDSEFNNRENILQVVQGRPVLFAGKGQTYSYFLWFYWDTDEIKNAINEFISQPLPNDFELGTPYLGFDGRTGAFLYWYTIVNDKLLWIICGSNSANSVYIYYCDKPSEITSLPYTDLETVNPTYRIKCNRWYDNIYFSLNNSIFVIKPPEKKLEAEVDYGVYENWQDISVSGTNGYSNYLHSEIRFFNPEQCTCVRLDLDNVYMTEFADFGDVIIQYTPNKLQTDIEEFNYIGLLNKNGINQSEDDSPKISRVFSIEKTPITSSVESVMNPLVMDDIGKQNNLRSMYRRSALHIKYFIDHGYNILYLGSNMSVGYDQEHDMLLVLYSGVEDNNGILQRIRVKRSDCNTIVSFYGDGAIKYYNGHYYRAKFTGDADIQINDSVFLVDRRCWVCKSTNPKGCFRMLGDMDTND